MLERIGRKWTEEQLERLHQLFHAGEQIGAIAAAINQEFGTSYTAASVQGQATSRGMRRERVWVDAWTDETTAQLRDLVASRKSHRAIADIMGIKVGAVYRQVHKLGINEQCVESANEKRVAATTRAALVKEAVHYQDRMAELLNWVPREYREDAPLPIFCAVVDDPLNLSMAEVGAGQCRYIMNDDAADPKFCGHSTARKSWCARHAEVVLV